MRATWVFAATAALLFAGCASTEVKAPGAVSPIVEVPAEPPPPQTKSTPSSPTAPATSRQPTAPNPPPVPPPAPKPKPKPWRIDLVGGSHAATFDGVRVYLALPALPAKKGRTPTASALDRKLTLAPLLKARAKPLVQGRPLRVCIDPGHGGEDSGARSRDGKTLEKSVSLDLARRLKNLLESDGAEVLVTRASDSSFLKLEDRAAKAKRWKADVFVSLHLNANAKADPRGVETYAMPFCGAEATSWDGKKRTPDSYRAFPGNSHDVGNTQLAFCIQRRLVAATGLPDRGVRRARFVVLREAGMPGVLVECGFVTNAKDLAKLRTAAGLDSIARGVYEGICDFALGTMAPGLPAHIPGSGGLGAPAKGGASASAPAAPRPTKGGSPVSFVQGGDSRISPYTAPPPTGGDAATKAAREAAIKAAGL